MRRLPFFIPLLCVTLFWLLSCTMPSATTVGTHAILTPTTTQAEPTFYATNTPSLGTALPPTATLAPMMLKELLFGATSSTCALPCWQGLRIGESEQSDVQDV